MNPGGTANLSRRTGTRLGSAANLSSRIGIRVGSAAFRILCLILLSAGPATFAGATFAAATFAPATFAAAPGKSAGTAPADPMTGRAAADSITARTAADSITARAAKNLRNHVDAQGLTLWRQACSPEEAAAFDFLFAWIPSSDLAAWRADQVIADIDLALKTRAESSWSKEIPEALFRTYVLPPRSAQEPIQPWRPRLHDLLRDRVQGKSLYDAALEVNRFCREQATFMPTSSRDQGPLTTMERGLGRCEEETIFFIAAARSVGIPARPCYTPWWTASDNNHAWVEVFTGDGWHYLGACEPEDLLDRAWFTGPARRAGLVLSVAYGEGDRPDEEVYSQANGATLVNSTAVYTDPGRVRVVWTDLPANGSPAPRDTVRISVNVFNSGALTAIGEFKAGRGILLGPGDYVASCEVDGRPVAALFTVRAGEPAVLRLDPRASEARRIGWLERPFWLRIPVPGENTGPNATRTAGPVPPGPEETDPNALMAQTVLHRTRELGECNTALIRRTNELAVARNDLERLKRSKIEPGVIAALTAHGCEGASLEALLSRLDPAGPRAPEWAAFLAQTAADTFGAAHDLVSAMDDKDLFECDTTSARTAIRAALAVRSWRAAGGAAVPDSVWSACVLSPRIGYEPGGFGIWAGLPVCAHADTGTVLCGSLDQARAAGSPEAARRIHTLFASSVRPAAPARLGHVAAPCETWASRCGTKTAARVALVALFRRNGIPARLDPERRWVEAWSDGAWIPMDPLDAASWNRRAGSATEGYESPGHVEVAFTDLGAPMLSVEGWRHFTLERLEHGRFVPVELDFPVRAGHFAMDLEPGDYWLFAGQRNHAGNPRIQGRRFHIRPGGHTWFAMDLGIPPRERDAEDLAAEQLAQETVGKLRLAGAGPGHAPASGSPMLVFVWTDDSEPCRRTADALSSAWKSLGQLGFEAVSISVARKPGTSRAIFEHGRRLDLDLEQAQTDFGVAPGQLPVIALVDASGKTLLHTSGMQLAAEDLIRQAWAQRQR